MTGYETKDSGERMQWDTGMQRDTDKGKPRFDLLVPQDQAYDETLLYRVAALMTRGAQKYKPRNWEQARTQEEYDRFRSSAFRHFMQWFAGETDEDHAAAVFFNMQGAEYTKGRIATPQAETTQYCGEDHPNYDFRACERDKGHEGKHWSPPGLHWGLAACHKDYLCTPTYSESDALRCEERKGHEGKHCLSRGTPYELTWTDHSLKDSLAKPAVCNRTHGEYGPCIEGRAHLGPCKDRQGILFHGTGYGK